MFYDIERLHCLVEGVCLSTKIAALTLQRKQIINFISNSNIIFTMKKH